MTVAQRLSEYLSAAAGEHVLVSITGRQVEATPDTPAVQTALAEFDWSDEAHAAWQEDQQPERKSVRQAASNAIADNDTFLALASPTNPQVLAQVKRLTQQNNRIIRLLAKD
jgi:hypothetical protein